MISKRILKLIKSLQQKKYRKKYKLFLVEGSKNVRELLHATRFSIRTLIITPVFMEEHKELIDLSNIGEIIITDATQLSVASTFKSNNAALAITEIPTAEPSLSTDIARYSLLLDDINDPGNLGTILRIADWYGIPEIICSPDTADLYNPKVISASMGSFLRVSVIYMELDTFFSQNQKTVYAAYADAGENVHDLQFAEEGVILMGSESHGIHPRYIPHVDLRVHIPSYGQAESLNVSIATAILCDNMRRFLNN